MANTILEFQRFLERSQSHINNGGDDYEVPGTLLHLGMCCPASAQFINAGSGGPGDLDAHIEDSRIYTSALSDAEIKKLLPDTLDVEAHDKLATTWARLKTE